MATFNVHLSFFSLSSFRLESVMLQWESGASQRLQTLTRTRRRLHGSLLINFKMIFLWMMETCKWRCFMIGFLYGCLSTRLSVWLCKCMSQTWVRFKKSEDELLVPQLQQEQTEQVKPLGSPGPEPDSRDQSDLPAFNPDFLTEDDCPCPVCMGCLRQRSIYPSYASYGIYDITLCGAVSQVLFKTNSSSSSICKF